MIETVARTPFPRPVKVAAGDTLVVTHHFYHPKKVNDRGFRESDSIHRRYKITIPTTYTHSVVELVHGRILHRVE